MNTICKQLCRIANQLQELDQKESGLLDSIKDFFKGQKDGAGIDDQKIMDATSQLRSFVMDKKKSADLLLEILSGDTNAIDFLKPMQKYKSLHPIVKEFQKWIGNIYNSFKSANPQASAYLNKNKNGNLDKFKEEKIFKDMAESFHKKLKESCDQITNISKAERNQTDPDDYGELKSFDI